MLLMVALHPSKAQPAGRSPRRPPQLQQVVRDAPERPLAGRLGMPAHQETVKASALHLTEHWLHGRCTLWVDRSPSFRSELSLHALTRREIARNAAAGGRLLSQRLALLPVFGRGDEQFGLIILEGCVRLAPIARIREALRRPLSCLCFTTGQHRSQLTVIDLFLRHGLSNNDLTLTIDRRLTVVALYPALPGFHNAAIRVRRVRLLICIHHRFRWLRLTSAFLASRALFLFFARTDSLCLLTAGFLRLLGEPFKPLFQPPQALTTSAQLLWKFIAALIRTVLLVFCRIQLFRFGQDFGDFSFQRAPRTIALERSVPSHSAPIQRDATEKLRALPGITAVTIKLDPNSFEPKSGKDLQRKPYTSRESEA